VPKYWRLHPHLQPALQSHSIGLCPQEHNLIAVICLILLSLYSGDYNVLA